MTRSLGGIVLLRPGGSRLTSVPPGPGEEPEPDPDPADWWQHRYLYPPPDKVHMGYYENGSPYDYSIAEGRYGRAFNWTTVYQGNGRNELTNLRSRIEGHLAVGRMVRQSLRCSYHWQQSNAANVESYWRDVADGVWDDDGSDAGGAYKGWRSTMRTVVQSSNRIAVSFWHEHDGRNDGGGAWINPSTRRFSSAGDNGTNVQVPLGTGEEFQAAWRHLVDMARDIRNTEGGYEPVWMLNAAYSPTVYEGWGGVGGGGTALYDSVGGSAGNDSGGYYPGHNYVDWVGSDPYNQFGYKFWNVFRDLSTLWSMYGGVNWWEKNFRPDGYRTLAEAAAAGQPGKVYKPYFFGETGTCDNFAKAPYNYTSLPAGTASLGDPGTWFTNMITWLNSNSTAFPAYKNRDCMRLITYFSRRYWNGATPTATNGALMNNADTLVRNQVGGYQKWNTFHILGDAPVFETPRP